MDQKSKLICKIKKMKNWLEQIIKSKLFWIIIVFISASIFRLSNLELIEFKGDEQQTVQTVKQFYAKPEIIQSGMFASNGIHNFPLFNYIMIAIGIPSKSPEYLTFIVAQLNVYMIILFFLTVDKFYGRKTAIFSSIILSFSPWAILFSRKIWEQDLLLLFSIPCLYFLNKLILTKKESASLPLFIFLALAIQIHGSGIFFTLTIVITFLILKVKFNIKKACIGFLLGFIPAIFFIYYQFSSLPICPDCIAFQKYIHQERTFDPTNFIRPFQIISSASFNQTLGDSYMEFLKQSPIIKLSEELLPLECIIIIYSSYVIFKYKKKHLFILIVCIILPIIYYITGINALMHYFIVILPFLSLLYGLAFTEALKRVKNSYKILLLGGFAFIVITKILFEIQFNHFLLVTKVIKGDYGTIYAKQTTVNKMNSFK